MELLLVDTIQIGIVLFLFEIFNFRKFSMKFGRRPLRSMLCKSFSIPCFHVVSNAFSMSKKMTVTCFFL